MDEKPVNWVLYTSVGVGLVIVLVLLWLALGPIYRVWQQGKSGEARLREATFSRQVKVLEARAHLESEKLNAEAEVVRAGGVARSNHIIKTSIDDQYIRYLWVKTLDGAQKEIIYVPTEANLPITEATRLNP